MLSVDENEPITIRGLDDYKIIRTGVIGDGSCFFHSLFTGMNAKVFKSMSERERHRYVADQRLKISESLDKDTWLNLSDGNIASMATSVTISRILQKIVRLFVGKKVDLPDEIVEFIKTHRKGVSRFFENYDTYETKIISPLMNKLFKNKINIRHSLETISEWDKVPIEFRHLFEIIFKHAVSTSFEKYKAVLGSASEYVTDATIKLISDYYKINYILIKDGEIYDTSHYCEMKANGRMFVIIYYIDETHFESIAVITPPENYAVRLFKSDSPIINKLLSGCP